jgi:predicted nucleotidyltransferase
VRPEAPEAVLGDVANRLRDHGVPFALVGGLAVSIRSEVRFTRDVDLAVAVSSDAAMEALVRDLAVVGYRSVAIVEHEVRKRLATARLESPSGVLVDLLAASCGIESEVVARAGPVTIEGAGEIPVARAEELVAMKVLSMTERRLQDRLDAINLLLTNPSLQFEDVREMLALITTRGYDRGQDLARKLDALIADAKAQKG